MVTPDCRELPGWPRKGLRFFASSPSLGDVNGDGSPEIFCGNDDHALYGWHLDGSPLDNQLVTKDRGDFSQDFGTDHWSP